MHGLEGHLVGAILDGLYQMFLESEIDAGEIRPKYRERLTRSSWVRKRTSIIMDLVSDFPEHRRRVPETGQAHKGRVRNGIEISPYQHADCRLVLARYPNLQNGAAASSPSRSTITLNVLTAWRNHYTVQQNARSL